MIFSNLRHDQVIRLSIPTRTKQIASSFRFQYSYHYSKSRHSPTEKTRLQWRISRLLSLQRSSRSSRTSSTTIDRRSPTVLSRTSFVLLLISLLTMNFFLATRIIIRHVRRWIPTNGTLSSSNRIFIERCVDAISTDHDTVEWSGIYQTFAIGGYRTSTTSKSNRRRKEKRLAMFSSSRFVCFFSFEHCTFNWILSLKRNYRWPNPRVYSKKMINSIWVSQHSNVFSSSIFLIGR